MKVTSVEKKEKSTVELTIQIDADQFEAAVQQAYLKSRGSISVPGFRKGKAPRKIIEGMYGSGVFYEEAINDVYPAAYEEAVKEQGLDDVGYPKMEIVEVGKVDEIFYDARHPYTWALLSALPQLGVKGEALPTIDGTPPNLFNKIKGDAFAPRNRQALAIDFEEEPPYFEVSETHKAKTWYLDPRAPKIERPHSIQNLREKMGKMGGSNLNG